MCFPKREQVVNSVFIKNKKKKRKKNRQLPLTPPSEGLAAHFSSPGTVLVSSRVTKIAYTHTCRCIQDNQSGIIFFELLLSREN